MSVGNTIKQIRKQKKLTQQELADELKISRSYLSDIENGNKNPSIKTIQTLADKLNVTVSYLTSGHKMFKDLTDEEKKQQFLSISKNIAKQNTDKEINVKNNYLELIKKDLSFTEIHYLNNAYNFLHDEEKENIIYISVLLQQLSQYKGNKDKEVYGDIINDFDEFVKKYLEIK